MQVSITSDIKTLHWRRRKSRLLTNNNKKKKRKEQTCPRAEKKQTNMAALPHYPEFNHETKNKAQNGQNMSTDWEITSLHTT